MITRVGKLNLNNLDMTLRVKLLEIDPIEYRTQNRIPLLNINYDIY